MTDKSPVEQIKELMPQARIEMLEDENRKLRKALDIYQRERDRFKHNKPELTGEYFLAGGYGEKDTNMLPEFVRICPAYGCAWEQIYVKTDRTVSYEGS
jgi:hypothetical protein